MLRLCWTNTTETTSYVRILVIILTVCGFVQHANTQAASEIPQISDNRTISVVNNCSFPVYPAILTTNGTGPYTTGFYLDSKERRDIWVGWDWSGRLWAHCGPAIKCQLSGLAPTTLAEFTITGWQQQTFYDISLVDGYDLDMKITPSHDSPDKPRVNNTPICVASTTLSSPLSDKDRTGNSLNESFTFGNIHRWCPREMLLFVSQRGRQSVFPYPDDNDASIGGGWTPCLSACAHSGGSWDCCTREHDTPERCGPNLYSRRAKQVCGDAYSYAYDDYLSTFAVPSVAGEGFEVMFCPGGVSTNILKSTLGSDAGRSVAVGKIWASVATIAIVAVLSW
ncbi:hypothetical protein DRE_06826 [Drechslerella stenobrocha 248]|uniref:Osmotin, thaumatin-like protein n=1 Tax=Drechslerella stenobrocha 248 TaxID=1043628 RepID=W7HX28_9PEZI|nr:hypothetical protein DRE_06826 [Drechslerella stenobrocha 248]